MNKNSATILALSIALSLSPLKLFSQGKKAIFPDPFSSAGKFINPAAANFSPGTMWSSLGFRLEDGNAGPTINYRQDGRNFGGICRLSMEFSQQNGNPVPLFLQQTMLFARIAPGEGFTLYPIAAYEFGICRNGMESQGYMLGMAASTQVWKLGINGYAGYADEKGLPSNAGKGAVAGLGWIVKGRIMEVHHSIHKDFRTGARVFTVDTRFRQGGIMMQTEKDGKGGKTTWVGVHKEFGKGPMRASAWAKAGFIKGKQCQPAAGITLMRH